MTFDHWITILFGVMALISGFFYWLDAKKTAELAGIKADIKDAVVRSTAEHAAMRSHMVQEHAAITATVSDMAESIRNEYVHRREFDIEIRNLDAGVTDARKEIGAVGVQVGKVHERIDRMVDRQRSTGLSDG